MVNQAGALTAPHGLGRLLDIEVTNAKRAYPMRLALADVPLPTQKVWTPGPVLDQGQTPMCVGFATKDDLNTEPNPSLDPTPGQDPTPEAIYAAAQAVDGFPMPHDGTTVRAAMQVMQAQGRIAAYLWASTLNDLITWLSTKGPVVVGINWYEGMDTPGATGFVTPTGRVRGGHAFELHGAHNDQRYVDCQNSWGIGWALGGFFKLSYSDLARLVFQENGECAGFLEPGTPPPPPVPPPAPVDPRIMQARDLLSQVIGS
jgi:hypothetical protein